MSNKLLDLKNISVCFDDTVILKNINLYICDGEFITLLGPSGCGKTTTLRIIAGFINPDTGDVLFEGKRINNSNTHGTGCTLSSAIASNLAKGFALAMSVKRAKDYISDALSAQLDLGEGSGPMMHNFDLTSSFAKEKESV